jgi:repressor LexA
MDSMSALTEKQQAVLEFIAMATDQNGSPPTLREIAGHFGFRSKTAAADHIRALQAKGLLRQEAPRKARGLRLMGISRRRPRFDIPLFGSIPAGFSGDREQEPDGCVSVDVNTLGFRPTRNTFALRVTGDSMIGRHICDGDIAVFEHGADPRPGQIVAALIDRKSTLKTFLVKNGKPFLKAENPKYPDLIPSDELVIQGVLRALIRKAE